MDPEPSTYPALPQIRKHYQTMKNCLEHHHAQIAAVQEELINSQSRWIHNCEERIRIQNQNIESLQKEVERLRGALTGVRLVGTSADRIESAGDTRSNKSDQCTGSFGTPASQDGNRFLRINKRLPPRPISGVLSIDTSLINNLDTLVTEFQSSRTPTPTQRGISTTSQPQSPVFYNPYFPQSTFPPPILPVTDQPSVPLSPRPSSPTPSQAATPQYHIESKGDSNPPSSPHKKRPTLPPLHGTFILPRPSPGLTTTYEGNLSPCALTPDKFFRRSSSPLHNSPKTGVSSRLWKISRSRMERKEIVIEEEPDEVIRATIREEVEKRKKAVFGDVEKIEKNNIIHSTVTTGVSGAPSTGTVGSRGVEKEKGALIAVFPLGVKKGKEGKNGDVIDEMSITHSSATLASTVGTPRIEAKSKFKECGGVGTDADSENVAGFVGGDAGSPPLDPLRQILSEGSKQSVPGLRYTVRKKLSRYLTLGCSGSTSKL